MPVQSRGDPVSAILRAMRLAGVRCIILLATRAADARQWARAAESIDRNADTLARRLKQPPSE
jgi:hypothetical protein